MKVWCIDWQEGEARFSEESETVDEFLSRSRREGVRRSHFGSWAERRAIVAGVGQSCCGRPEGQSLRSGESEGERRVADQLGNEGNTPGSSARIRPDRQRRLVSGCGNEGRDETEPR